MQAETQYAADNLLNYTNEISWLVSKNILSESTRCFVKVSPLGRSNTTLHAAESCIHAMSTTYGYSEKVNGVNFCSCLFANVLESTTPRAFFAALHNLRDYEYSLLDALEPYRYSIYGEFPAFRALAIKYHRANNSRYIPVAEEVLSNSTLSKLYNDLIALWDQAESEYPLHDAILLENAKRYAARSLVVSRITSGIRLGSPSVHILVAELVEKWFAKPLTNSLLDEYFADENVEIRKELCSVKCASFSLKMLEELDELTSYYYSNDKKIACHMGSYGLEPFATTQGPRALLIWHGIRVISPQRAAWGEYDELVVKWFTRDINPRTSRVYESLPGGPVLPICPSIELDDSQWVIAMHLWEESFGDYRSDANKDPGPYRDMATALHAAQSL